MDRTNKKCCQPANRTTNGVFCLFPQINSTKINEPEAPHSRYCPHNTHRSGKQAMAYMPEWKGKPKPYSLVKKTLMYKMHTKFWVKKLPFFNKPMYKTHPKFSYQNKFPKVINLTQKSLKFKMIITVANKILPQLVFYLYPSLGSQMDFLPSVLVHSFKAHLEHNKGRRVFSHSTKLSFLFCVSQKI